MSKSQFAVVKMLTWTTSEAFFRLKDICTQSWPIFAWNKWVSVEKIAIPFTAIVVRFSILVKLHVAQWFCDGWIQPSPCIRRKYANFEPKCYSTIHLLNKYQINLRIRHSPHIQTEVDSKEYQSILWSSIWRTWNLDCIEIRGFLQYLRKPIFKVFIGFSINQ